MRLKRMSLAILLLGASAIAQDKPKPDTGREVFLVRDHRGQQWCGYQNRLESKDQAERLDALIIVEVKYVNNRVSTVYVTENAESGDWRVEDKYSLDEGEMLQSLSRGIENFTLGITQKELFRIQRGEAIKQSSNSRASGTGKPTNELSGPYLPDVKIVTNLHSFPFWSFVRDKREEVWAKGRACSWAK